MVIISLLPWKSKYRNAKSEFKPYAVVYKALTIDSYLLKYMFENIDILCGLMEVFEKKAYVCKTVNLHTPGFLHQ